VRKCVVENGINDASLRLIAVEAGVSVGSISHHFGDRSELIEAFQLLEFACLAERQQDWIARVRGLGVPDDERVRDLVAAWLDDEVLNHRHAAIACCELVLRSARALSGASDYLAQTETFWRAMLEGRSDAAELGMLLARYCTDELPFSILLGDDPDYRLLRAATFGALLSAQREAASEAKWHAMIVDRLGERVRAVTDGTGLLVKPQKAALAGRIADLIEHEGFSVLTHRRVAQLADVPVSSVAHHFPQQRDLVLGGIEAAYDRMRLSMRSANGQATASGAVVILLTHEMALAALRDADLRPFAIDMRRRRGENVREELSRSVLPGKVLGGDLTQALVMTMVGEMIGQRAAGRDELDASAPVIDAYRGLTAQA
jgi:AcrR family transcriptional regulator